MKQHIFYQLVLHLFSVLILQISWFWKICWSIIPVILSAIFVIAMVFWTEPTYSGSQEKIYYPQWAHHIGWFLTLVTALQIPLIAIFMVVYYGCKGRIREVRYVKLIISKLFLNVSYINVRNHSLKIILTIRSQNQHPIGDQVTKMQNTSGLRINKTRLWRQWLVKGILMLLLQPMTIMQWIILLVTMQHPLIICKI